MADTEFMVGVVNPRDWLDAWDAEVKAWLATEPGKAWAEKYAVTRADIEFAAQYMPPLLQHV